MRKTDLNRPFPLFVAPHGRTATVEALFTVEPEHTLPPGDLEEVLGEVALRIGRALQGVFDNLPAKVAVDDVSIVNPQHVPFFPATFGDRVCGDPVEVFEEIEKLREGTPLGGLLYDCTGRAFGVRVWASFQRKPEEDRKVSEVWTLEGENGEGE